MTVDDINLLVGLCVLGVSFPLPVCFLLSVSFPLSACFPLPVSHSSSHCLFQVKFSQTLNIIVFTSLWSCTVLTHHLIKTSCIHVANPDNRQQGNTNIELFQYIPCCHLVASVYMTHNLSLCLFITACGRLALC